MKEIRKEKIWKMQNRVKLNKQKKCDRKKKYQLKFVNGKLKEIRENKWRARIRGRVLNF